MMSSKDNFNSKSKKYLSAMKDVQKNGMSLRAAAKKWGIPKSSLYERICGRVEYDRRSGPPPILTKKEERYLAKYLLEMDKNGRKLTKNNVFDIVKKMLDEAKRKTQFTDNRPGEKWLRLFLARNNVKLPCQKKRAKTLCKDGAVRKWFSGYEQLIREHSLADCPGQIWRCYETCFNLQGSAGKVVGLTETVDTASNEQLTLLSCFSACGQQWIPPFLIIPGKRIPRSFNPLEGGVTGCNFTITDKGSMDDSALYIWFEDHFIPNLPPERPIVLLIESGTTDMDVIEVAEKNEIKIYENTNCLATEDSFSCALKETWSKRIIKYSKTNPNTDITKKNFCSVFKSAWEALMQPETLINAFRISGVFDASQITNDHHDDHSSATPCSPSLLTMDTTGPSMVATVEVESSEITETNPCSSEEPN
ncbi:uncharacterized protein LOC114522874 [Dendronephthya gigantea]|uniref:uncharacterized protein LOC114522874 n=1 Tax=Dendronephthya gigantea TaxID=151771 RepID=UPI00106A7774|nr:uncharacterized protein LOC114522874 [Dendronephthya gigantea]